MRNVLLSSFALMICLNLWQFAANNQRSNDIAVHSGITQTHLIALSSSTKLSVGTNTKSSLQVLAPTPVVSPIPILTPPPTSTPDPQAATEAILASAGLNPTYAGLYVATQVRTGTPWQLLASIHHYETGQSANTDRTSSAGAVGPMQFLPATFQSYALDGDNDGEVNITDVADAIMTAGNYLSANGASQGDYTAALYRYNHSNEYVSRTLALAVQLGL